MPQFASFPLLDDPRGASCAGYFSEHLRVAATLDRVNREAVAFLRGLAEEHPEVAVGVSGNIGPRGDEQLDNSDPTELGSLYAEPLRSHSHRRVLGGCCGTDAAMSRR